MSWPQRPGAAAPAQLQRQPQGYNKQQNAYPNYQGAAPPPAVGGAPQQYWQAQPPQFNQQYNQVYQQQDYGSNANQFYPQPTQYNQNYSNQGYANTQQQQYQSNYYQNQGVQQAGFQNQPKADGWEDNWDWGWEESAKQAQQAIQPPAPGQAALPPQHQQVYNNANVIEESFVSTDTWNWATEDKKENSEPAPPKLEPPKPENSVPAPENHQESSSASEPPPRNASNASSHAPIEEVKTLSDREVVKERLPNLALGKRFHLDNLTPQWSIESQMSQESSDGPQTHSEGTYRSDNQSRNSSKSSPGLNTENSNFNYSQSVLDEYPPTSEWSRHSNEETTLVDNAQSGGRSRSQDELTNSLQDMNITNRENPAPEQSLTNKESTNLPLSPAAPPSAAMLPAPPVTTGQPPPPSSLPLPPTSFPPSSSSTNPFKQAGPFSHKKTPSASPAGQAGPPASSANLSSPAAVGKAAQHGRPPLGFGANLETTPDNSERPDQPQPSPYRPPAAAHPVPDNLEVAPQNDRNEYLQTAHLSGGDFGAPPLGLRRMVVGRQEAEYGPGADAAGDEPPPGLARMVPGRQTEAADGYGQPADDYLERHVDGQTTDRGDERAYRRADGRRSPDYTQPRGADRRPIGLDRMVPGEPSAADYPQYAAGYAAADRRVVTGVERDAREPGVDGSDYSEPAPDYGAPRDDRQRELTVEGENLQDLSAVSSIDAACSRDRTLDAADAGPDRRTDPSDSAERAAPDSRRQSLTRVDTSGEDSARDRAFKASPRRDRDKHKSSRDRDRDKEGRYSRGERNDREERRSVRDKDRDWERDKRERPREDSPHSRRYRRSTRSRRYDTEDTDYYSDRERDRRAYCEGSYAAKPPRPDDKERRYERERSRRYNTIERDRRPDRDDRHREDRHRDDRPRRERERERERYEARYRDIDPTRKHGNLEEERRRGELYSGASRPESAGGGAGGAGTATDEDLIDTVTSERRRDRRARRPRPDRDPYYDSYGAGSYTDAYELQRQQYEYYERLRATDPHAYLQVYKQLMAGRAPPPPPPPHLADPRAKLAYQQVYGMGYEGRGEDRGSVHSGRSSAGLKGNDTYYGAALRLDAGSLRDAPSLRTDLSDRELNTDASLNLHLEESTVRSDRMTPFKFSTAHVKASIGTRDVVVVRPSYPVDGRPATVHVLSLAAALARDPLAMELAAYPGPLIKGVTHKKSVIEYCGARVRAAARAAPRDVTGYVLVWELLALLLRQNGVVVGSDIAELLMKNTKEYEYKAPSAKNSSHNESGRGSSLGGREGRAWSPEQAVPATAPPTSDEHTPGSEHAPSEPAEGAAALDRFRDLLTYGNRQEALECAMSAGLWGHALALAGGMERRWRAVAAARFLAAQPAADPLHTLYAHLQARTPPAATCASDERWGDWRPHAAIVLANTSPKPEHDRRTLTQLGDSLLSRGLLYSAQFCYVTGGVALSRHPLAPLQGPAAPGAAPAAPPRLALLLADSRAATLAQLATNQAIFATEIYEYALSLNQDYIIDELQVYKVVLATRLVDCGEYERALAYVEAGARGAARGRGGAAAARALAALAERLALHDPALHAPDDADDSAEPSPRHHWREDLEHVARMLTAEESQQNSPQRQPAAPPPDHTGWGEHQPTQQYQYQQPYTEQQEEQPQPDYSQGYQHPQETAPAPPTQSVPLHTVQPLQAAAAAPPQSYDEWPTNHQPSDTSQHYDSYWQSDGLYSYSEGAGAGAGEGAGEGERPQISMPGAAKPQARPQLYADYEDEPSAPHERQEREAQSPKSGPGKKQEKAKEEGGRGAGGGWLGGILTKLSLRAPNQMILPDDKNPTIVWDAENKRWINKEAAEEGPPAALAPPPLAPTAPPAHAAPPTHPHPAPSPPVVGAGAGGAAPPLSNIFKMQKSRHIKKSYVDVFNPSGAACRERPPAADVLGPPGPAPAPAPAPALAPNNSYFVPAPAPAPHSAEQMDLYDPALLDTHSGI